MSFASCMLKQLLLVSARQVVKTTALYERTSSPWFKPHKLHFFVESDKSLFWDEGYLYSCVLSAIVTNSAMLWAYIQRENTVCLWCWVRFPLYLDRVVCTYMLGVQIPRSNLACFFDHEIFAWENHPRTWISPVVVNIPANLLQVGIKSRLWSRRF